MWLPSGTKLPGRTGAMFYRRAYSVILPDSATFAEFASKMREATVRALAKAENIAGASRALGFGARGAAHAVITGEASALTARAVGFRVTADDIVDVNRMLDGDWSRIASDGAKAEAMLNRLGLPMTAKTFRMPKDVPGTDPHQAIRVILTGASDDSGAAHFMVSTALRDLDGHMPAVIKELDARYAPAWGSTGALARVGDGAKTLTGWWRTSVVTGLLIPQPRYLVNNAVADFSQMWMEVGLVPATAQSLQNLPINIPFFGRYLQDWTSELMRRAGKPTLGTAWNALFNPHIQAIWNPSVKGRMVTRLGEVIPYDRLRLELVEDGILDTMTREEITAAFTRASPGWAFRAVKDYQDSISHFANFVQQRQRTGLYSALRQAGHTREDARRITLAALYDWKNGFAQREAMSLVKAIPFARFWTLSLGQTVRAGIDPLIKPSEQFMKALTGRSGFARIRQQQAFFGNLHRFISPEESEEEQRQLGEWGETAAHLNPLWAAYARPGWAPNRPFVGAFPNDQYWKWFWQESRGRVLTHNMMLAPPPTMLETSSLILSWLEGLVAFTSWLAGQAGALGMESFARVPDWEVPPVQQLIQMAFPWLRDPLMQFFESMAVSGGAHVMTSTPITPGEAALFQNGLPLAPSMSVWRNPDTGQWEAPTFPVWLWRLIPLFGTQVPGLMNSAWSDNPGAQEYARDRQQIARLLESLPYETDPAKQEEARQTIARLQAVKGDHLADGLQWFFRDWALAVKRYPYDPWRELAKRQTAIERGLKAEARGEARGAPVETEVVRPRP